MKGTGKLGQSCYLNNFLFNNCLLREREIFMFSFYEFTMHYWLFGMKKLNLDIFVLLQIEGTCFVLKQIGRDLYCSLLASLTLNSLGKNVTVKDTHCSCSMIYLFFYIKNLNILSLTGSNFNCITNGVYFAKCYFLEIAYCFATFW